jgi:hypothetical protein
MFKRSFAALSLVLVSSGALAVPAGAQVLGTFRWQLAPHCNVLTLTVEQRAGGYRLDGTDAFCGAPVRAAASGTAHVNPNGSVSIAVTVTRPDGIAIQHNLSLTLPALSGTWTDDVGNGGTLAFSPSTPAVGSPRGVTLRGIYLLNFTAALANNVGVSEISFGRLLPAAPIPHLVTSSTPECPGSADVPQAAPGHLCVYAFPSQNVSEACVSAVSGGCDNASRLGASVWVESAGEGRVYHAGAWAVTLP